MLSPWQLKKRLLMTAVWIVAAYGLALAAVYPIIARLEENAPPDRSVRPPDLNAADLLSFIVPTSYGRFGGSELASMSKRFPALPQNDTAYMGVLMIVIAVWFLGSVTTFD